MYNIRIENFGPAKVLLRATSWDYVGLRPWATSVNVTVSKNKLPWVNYSVIVGVGKGHLHRSGLFNLPMWAWESAASTFSDEYLHVRQETEENGYTTYGDRPFLVYKPCLTIGGGGESLNVIASNRPTEYAKQLAFDIHLECLLSAKACTTLCQLRPKAWAQFLSEGAHGCNMDEEALEMARRACGDWAGRVGNAGKLTTDN